MRLPLVPTGESWAALRRRMLRETEVFLEEGLRRGDREYVIPAIRVGAGTFPAGLAEAFWSRVLGTS